MLTLFASGYKNALVTEGHYDPPNGLDWWWPGFIDDTLDDEKSRDLVARRFIEDVLAYHYWRDLLKIVLDEMSDRGRQHEEALKPFLKGWIAGDGDHPMRIPVINGTMRASAGYKQLVYLANDGISTLLAAYADEALIFQGRK